jgi:sporulation protein YlmC with PRC-barrel domain
MGICELEKFYTINEIKKKLVISVDDLEVGRVIDVIFDHEFKVHSFIIGGSRWEEFRERLGIIDDIDPVVPASAVKSVDDKSIQLTLTKSKLHHKLEEGSLPEIHYSYNDLKRKKMFDSRETKFGKIVNMGFLPCGDPILVVGGTFFEELSERLGFKENVDLLLPLTKIDTIDKSNIKLNVPIDELNLTADNKPMTEIQQNHYLNSLKAKGVVEIKLFERRKAEEFKPVTRFQ